VSKQSSLKKLEQEALLLGYKIILGKGTFQSNFCLVKEKKVIVVNKLLDDKTKVDVLTELLSRIKSGQPISSEEIDIE
jgi:hypothetical protein